ncbi:lamin tail domain-containing protein [Streptomyces sp. NPDC026294]|uniref:lamin tail domain-containing protein n=1 Tax=Streptomyces sp. NPDC026294 TaxID=3155362 RepID=UPI0033DBFEE3
MQVDSPGRDDGSHRSLNAEWVPMKNTSRHTVNLKGWALTSERSHKTCRFSNLRLAGRQEMRVHTGRGRDADRDAYQDRRAYVWDNRRDTATPRDGHRHTIDTKHWSRR